MMLNGLPDTFSKKPNILKGQDQFWDSKMKTFTSPRIIWRTLLFLIRNVSLTLNILCVWQTDIFTLFCCVAISTVWQLCVYYTCMYAKIMPLESFIIQLTIEERISSEFRVAERCIIIQCAQFMRLHACCGALCMWRVLCNFRARAAKYRYTCQHSIPAGFV